jgi:NADH-quinone oxidoreductase subunit F
VPHIVNNGGEWYRQWGTEKSTGTKLFCVSGHVQRPGNYEVPMGFNFRSSSTTSAAAPPEGRTIKAVIPGGSSVPIMTADELDIGMDYEAMAAAGTMLGCGSVIVMDDTTDIVKQVRRMVDFYAHESCGQCTPCREGTAWAAKILRRVENGWGTEADLDTLLDISDNMSGEDDLRALRRGRRARSSRRSRSSAEDYLALIRRGREPGEGEGAAR